MLTLSKCMDMHALDAVEKIQEMNVSLDLVSSPVCCAMQRVATVC